MARWFIILFITLFALTSSGNELRLNVYTESLPPFQVLTNKNQISGINIELLEQMLEAENIRYDIVMYPWTRAFQTTLSDPQGALISTGFTTEREPLFHWVGPFLSTKQGVYLYKLSNRKDINISAISDLTNYTIGIVRGDMFGLYLLDQGVPKKNLMEFADNQTVHKMLFIGKVDLVIGSPNTMLDSAYKLKKSVEEFTKTIAIDASSGNYLAVNKSVSPEVITRLNKRLEKIRSATDIQAFQTKYQVEKKLHWK